MNLCSFQVQLWNAARHSHNTEKQLWCITEVSQWSLVLSDITGLYTGPAANQNSHQVCEMWGSSAPTSVKLRLVLHNSLQHRAACWSHVSVAQIFKGFLHLLTKTQLYKWTLMWWWYSLVWNDVDIWHRLCGHTTWSKCTLSCQNRC